MLHNLRKRFMDMTEWYTNELTDKDQAMIFVGLGLVAMGCIGMPQTLITIIRLIGFIALGGFFYALFLMNSVADKDEPEDTPEAE